MFHSLTLAEHVRIKFIEASYERIRSIIDPNGSFSDTDFRYETRGNTKSRRKTRKNLTRRTLTVNNEELKEKKVWTLIFTQGNKAKFFEETETDKENSLMPFSSHAKEAKCNKNMHCNGTLSLRAEYIS